jgi:hypothetical protein
MRTRPVLRHPHRAQRGSTVVVALALLGIMLALVAANAVTVHVLQGELKLLDHKQQHRLESGAIK